MGIPIHPDCHGAALAGDHGGCRCMRAEIERLRMAYRSLSDATSEVLGGQHQLKHVLGFIRRWRNDPNFDPDYEIKRAEDAVAEWHRRIVAAHDAACFSD